eukprot:CCRYP_000846-RA/>CCRYP_000846-RA protein AED:0.28 eAED:0.28 QI:206/0.85/0.87/1/1/1/8/1264/1475
MTKKKEDRSNWVAVQPEFSSSTTTNNNAIAPPITAYQFYQRQNTSTIRNELSSHGTQPIDVGTLTKEVSSRWRALDATERRRYEELAEEDLIRHRTESHRRDVMAMERRERLQRERETLVLEDEGEEEDEGRRRRTRKARRKAVKKAEKKKKKKDDEEDSDYKDDDGDDHESSAASSSDKDSDSDSSSASSSSRKKPKRPPSAAVLARRAADKQTKLEKEAYIAQRQSDVRGERAEQAKRRLEFLLKQSDIFSHFGNVKQEKARLGLTSGKKTDETTRIVRQSSKGGGNDDDDNVEEGEEDDESLEAKRQEEREEADEHEATYLTAQPATLGDGKGKMRQYQLEGLNWMIRLQENGVNGILADEMGLGKTMQSISILVYMMECKADNGPHLIIVPKSTLSNWMNELARWAPTLTSVKFHGTKEERAEIINNILQPGQRDEKRSWNVCVTTYEICNLERNVFNKFAWSYLIIDEAHRLKNEASTFSRVVRTLETRFRLLLTGTPLQNNLHELWALLNFLVPDVFASAEQFDEWFNLDIDDADEKNKLISQLHKILRPFMLRRLKADVEKSLRPKTETILFTGMSALQKKLYKDILMRDLDTLTGGSGGGSRTAVLNIVMQLRKCAGHPYLFPGVEDRSLPPLGEHLVENCGKMVLLDKLLIRLKERGHRVLLFTQMTRILDILEDYMHMRGFQYCRIDGNTTYEEREERIDAYNDPESEKFLFLLSTRAGGLGINLQTADVVILYDSDWNPQADLQAQDRAHRIGQKRAVQVFRLVTEDTIEQKVVERAQQKLKLDAMVVQQGRLKEKDKLSREELLDAVRFGADKIFKSKDSSITDDDIDMILGYGKKKTQELYDKLQAAQKGDMLDFKLDGGLSAQTFEGVDYSEEAKNAQFQAEILGIIDVGKRERRTVAYNENKLYMQQMAQHGGVPPKKKIKKEIQLPKMLRLPRIEEWQMFDRTSLYALQDIEEQAFRALPQEVQALAGGVKRSTPTDETKETTESEPPVEGEISQDVPKIDVEDKPADAADSAKEEPPAEGEPAIKSLPPLLSEEQQAEKRRLLAEGFSDWSRHHYSAFVKASAKYGRHNYAKIAIDVGKPLSSVKTYSAAFWDENFGKQRFSEHEYERVVKLIEKGEKKIEDIKGLQRGTKVLISLFENPWVELQFTHVNCKDKKFTAEEDRFLLCWAHKYGYGQWEAIKFAIRRSSNFRFDYFLKSLPPEAIGRRCEQLMRAAEKEVEAMEKQAMEEAERAGQPLPPGEIKLPMFKELQAKKRADAEKKFAEERVSLEKNLADIEKQIRQVQKALHDLDGVQPISKFFPSQTERNRNNNTLDEKNKKRKISDPEVEEEKEGGAIGPDGKFVSFPDYDGKEEPQENKKAFTLFCKATRKDDRINNILKDRWYDLTDEERDVWKEWEVWDAKRYQYQLNLYEKQFMTAKRGDEMDSSDVHKGNEEGSTTNGPSIPKRDGLFSIPKKRKH